MVQQIAQEPQSSYTSEQLAAVGLAPDAEAGLNIYRSNALQLAFEQLSEHYPVVLKYLGRNNFRYFGRLYLVRHGFGSGNIVDFVRGFVGFLQDTESLHQEPLLAHLAKVDTLWTIGNPRQCSVYRGIGHYWQCLLDEQSTEDTVVDVSATELLVREDRPDGQKVLKI